MTEKIIQPVRDLKKEQTQRLKELEERKQDRIRREKMEEKQKDENTPEIHSEPIHSEPPIQPTEDKSITKKVKEVFDPRRYVKGMAIKPGGIHASRLLRFTVVIFHYALLILIVCIVAFREGDIPLRDILIFIAGNVSAGVMSITNFTFPTSQDAEKEEAKEKSPIPESSGGRRRGE